MQTDPILVPVPNSTGLYAQQAHDLAVKLAREGKLVATHDTTEIGICAVDGEVLFFDTQADIVEPLSMYIKYTYSPSAGLHMAESVPPMPDYLIAGKLNDALVILTRSSVRIGATRHFHRGRALSLAKAILAHRDHPDFTIDHRGDTTKVGCTTFRTAELHAIARKVIEYYVY